MYSKVSFRHVNIARTPWLNERMREFIGDTLGKKYDLFNQKTFKQFALQLSMESSEYNSFI